MKLGTQTGSVMNHLFSRMTKGQPTPCVGMGATLLLWTDRHAGTITRVETIRKALVVEVQDDTATVVAGSSFDGSAEYEYTRNPNGGRHLFRFNEKAGKWEAVHYAFKGTVEKLHINADGSQEMRERAVYSQTLSKCKSGPGLRIGARDEYRDPCF